MQETGVRGPKRMTDGSLRCSFPELGAKSSSSASIRHTFVALINIRCELSSASWPDAPAGDGEKGRALFLNRQHRPSGNPGSCSSPCPRSRISRLWGRAGDLGRAEMLKRL